MRCGQLGNYKYALSSIIYMSNKMPTNDKIVEVARYFIKRSQEDAPSDSSKNIDALKLQKLLYYAKAWNLVFNKGGILFPDQFQAWVYGPVSPKIWDHFKDFDFSTTHPDLAEDNFPNITKKEKEVLDMVWGIYGKFDGKYLINLTHSEEPWLKARQGLNKDSLSQSVITDESMK